MRAQKFKIQNPKSKVVAGIIALTVLAAPAHAWACAACFGKSDSAMAQSANAGIFSLMAVIVPVLIAAATFFIFLARKAAAEASARAAQAKELPVESNYLR